MHVLVREETGERAAIVVQRHLFHAVVARLVMLESEMRDVVAEREQPVVMAEVIRAEQRARFCFELAVVVGERRPRFNRGRAVAGDVDAMWRRILYRR